MTGISTVVGQGIAGTPKGGVVTVQGSPTGTPIPVTPSGSGPTAMEVQGTAANGAAPVGNPVWISGYDGAAIRALLTDTLGNLLVAGQIATGIAVAGNPVQMGGADDTNLVRRINVDSTGAVRLQSGGLTGAAVPTRATQVGGSDGTNLRALHMASFTADAQALDDAANQSVNTVPSLYNGSTYDRVRNNGQSTILASAARTTTTDSADQTNYNFRGGHLILVVTAASGTGGLQTIWQGKDPVTNNYYQLNTAPTAVTATGTFSYEMYPGSTSGITTPTMPQRFGGVLPRIWRVRINHGDASSYTYSVGANLMP